MKKYLLLATISILAIANIGPFPGGSSSGGGGGTGTVSSVGTFDSQSPNANGSVIVAPSIYFQSANTIYPGMVNVDTQSFAGIKSFSDKVNIGTTTSLGRLTINNSSTESNTAYTTSARGITMTDTTTLSASNTNSALTIGLSSTTALDGAGFNSNGGIRGLVFLSQWTGSGNLTGQIYGISGNVNHSGSGTVSTVYNYVGGANNTSTGTITNAAAFATSITNTGGGTITNGFGLFVQPVTGVTNLYGIYSNIASGTNQWNFYGAGTATNYFNGATVIGDSTVTANAQLTVNTTTTQANTVLDTRAAYNYDDVTLSVNNTSGSSLVKGMENTAFLHTAVGKTFAGVVLGEYCVGAVDGSGSATHVRGFTSVAQALGTTTVTNLIGGAVVDSVVAGATATNHFGFYFLGLQNAGAVTNNYGAYITQPTGAGTLTNNYGIYIDSHTAGSSLNYALYSAGGKNYFAGQTEIGSSSQLVVTATGDLIKVANVSYGWPVSQGSASTVLTNNGSGILSWSAVSGGVTTMAAVGSSPNANGATISGSTLTLQPASASFPGLITTGTQTIAGNKTITGDTTLTTGNWTATTGASNYTDWVPAANNSRMYWGRTGTYGYFEIALGNGVGFSGASTLMTDNGSFSHYYFTMASYTSGGVTFPAIGSNLGLHFLSNDNVTLGQVGSYSTAGLWTLGASGGTLTHVINGSLNVTATVTADSITVTRILIPVKLVPTVVTLTDGATPALNAALGNQFVLVTTNTPAIGVPSNPTSGQKIVIRINASGGSRTASLNTGAGGFRYGSDITGLTAIASGKTDYIGAIYNATDNFWDVVAYIKGF